MLLFGLLLGRVICGWACPFGFLQELLHKLPGPKLKKSKLTQKLSRLKYLWAVVFVLILPFAFFFMTGIGVPAFCKFICPAGTLEGAVPLLSFNPMLRSAAGWLTVWKFSLLAVFTQETIRAPSSHFSTICGIRLTGFWKSQSISIVQSPVVWSMP
jgi:polyferredoxin